MLELSPLPYAEDALAPHIGAETLAFHYGKHHKGYVDKVNKLVDGTELDALSLVPLIRKVAGDRSKKTLFNNAAQVWNHDFYWRSMSPKGGGKPRGALAEKIDSELGGYDKFRKRFKEAATGQFGSGYCWLVVGDTGRLEIYGSPNAETPVAGNDEVPLLTADLWEHAYYLDHRNERDAYIDAFLDHLVDWDFAAANLASVASLKAGQAVPAK
ncbi:MAG: superoxide dismutase [Parvibaculum sp.]|uniref:superoxide dismutase n=1 Tax=Parvibaculum sp. TaxID=2024848 RepID=UPI0034A084E5